MVSAPLMEKNVSRPATSTDLTTLVGPYAEPVDRRLREYLKGLDGPEPLIDAICYAALAPGKRIRPALVLMSAEACGGQREPALPAACAVEIIHAYSLVHDDLPPSSTTTLRIDGADLRCIKSMERPLPSWPATPWAPRPLG